MTGRVYLDWNATAPLRPETRAAMISAMDAVGNPSSVHAEGRKAKGIVETARSQVASLLKCGRDDIVFTGSATEAIAMAFPDGQGAIGTLVEHDAVHTNLMYHEVDPEFFLEVDSSGVLTGTIKGASIFDGMWDDVVAVQAANSETGVCQNTLALAQEVWATQRGATLFVDAVQAVGKVDLPVDKTGADLLAVSAHKLGGPKGVGALFVKPGVEPAKVVAGGGQEMGRRSGTENVIGIAGFGAAAEAAERDLRNGDWDRVGEMRDTLEAQLLDEAPDLVVFGRAAPRLPNTSNFAVPGWKGETQVMQMDLAGFAISAGSACSSGKVKESRVLRAMGFDSVTASSAIRVSMGPTTTQAEVSAFADTWINHYRRFKQRAA